MTATDELRRMLDERGVEWQGREDVHTDFTFWCGVHACETGPMPSLAVYHLTPEQAVEATMGRGTCHDTSESRVFHCSECGFGIEDAYVEDERAYPPEGFPRFCPWCGAEVVSE